MALTPDDTCVALALSSFTFGTRLTVTLSGALNDKKNLCLIR